MNIVFHKRNYIGEPKEYSCDKHAVDADLVDIVYNPAEISVDARVQKEIRQFQVDARNLLFGAENCLFAKEKTNKAFVGYFHTVGSLVSDWMFELDDCLIILSNFIGVKSSIMLHMNLIHSIQLAVERDGSNVIFQLTYVVEYVPLATYGFVGETRKHFIDGMIDTL